MQGASNLRNWKRSFGEVGMDVAQGSQTANLRAEVAEVMARCPVLAL